MNKLILIGLCIGLILLSGCSSFGLCLEKCADLNGCEVTNRITYGFDCSYHNVVYNRTNNATEIELKCYNECRGIN